MLWLDAIEKKYVEEVGTSNIFFVINKERVTPALNGSILHGTTRDSVIRLLKAEDRAVYEREITIDEIIDEHNANRLKEAFATNTIAFISPIGKLCYGDCSIEINDNKIGQLT